MSRILEATCSASGVVSVAGIPVSDAVLMGEGAQSSSGILIVDKEVVIYIPAKASTDLKTSLEKLESTLTQVVTALQKAASSITAIGGVTGPSWTPPGSLISDATDINSAATQLNSIKSQVTSLKGALK